MSGMDGRAHEVVDICIDTWESESDQVWGSRSVKAKGG